jgi:hypothetical protein
MAATKSNGLNRGGTAPGHYPSSADSQEIRREIDRTRSEMDRTIDQLGERLQPRNLFDDIVCAVRGSLFGGPASTATSSRTERQAMSEELTRTAGQVGRGLLDAIRENPVPAALMGAGLAWLLFEDKAERAYRRHRIESHVRGYTGDRYRDPHTHSGSYVDARTGQPYDDHYGEGYADTDFDGEPDIEPTSAKEKAAEMASSAKESLSAAAHAMGDAARRAARGMKRMADKSRHAAEDVRHRAEEFRHTAGEKMHRASESARHYRDSTTASMRGLGHRTSESMHHAAESMRHLGRDLSERTQYGYAVSRERFQHALEDKPLALGVAALAAGLLAGFALPHTRMEDRRLGPTSDRLKDEARRRGREVMEEGREAVSHLAEAAMGEAEHEGLTPGSLGAKLSKVAKDALHAAQESAQREGIDPQSLSEKAKHLGDAVKEAGKEEFGIAKTQAESSLAELTDSPSLSGMSSSGMSSSGMSSMSDRSETSAGSHAALGEIKAGGLSDDMSSVGKEAETKHDIAEGMSKSAESEVEKSKTDKSGGHCSL